MKIVWNDAAINGPHSVVGDWLEQKGRELQVMAKSSVGVDTGALQANITVDEMIVNTQGALEISVGVNPGGTEVGYALHHHNGTKPHTILPKKPGGRLVFKKGGKTIYAKKVHHPGTKPNPYLTRWLRILFP